MPGPQKGGWSGGIGKTKILAKFLRDHPPVTKIGGGTSAPVVCLQMPPEPDERSFDQELLRVLNGAYGASAPAPVPSQPRYWRMQAFNGDDLSCQIAEPNVRDAHSHGGVHP